jgi:hypothetical protein
LCIQKSLAEYAPAASNQLAFWRFTIGSSIIVQPGSAGSIGWASCLQNQTICQREDVHEEDNPCRKTCYLK